MVPIVLVVAAPDGPLVLAVGMPDLGTIPAPALAALDLGGKGMHSAVILFAFTTPLYLALNHLEHVRMDDGFVVPLNVVLRNLTLIPL